MGIEIHVHVHNEYDGDDLLAELHQQHMLLEQLLAKETTAMALLDDLQAKVNENSTVIGSAVTLIQGLVAQIQAAQNDPVKMQTLLAELSASTQALAEAVANVPATTA
jgi:hypothetical protein